VWAARIRCKSFWQSHIRTAPSDESDSVLGAEAQHLESLKLQAVVRWTNTAGVVVSRLCKQHTHQEIISHNQSDAVGSIPARRNQLQLQRHAVTFSKSSNHRRMFLTCLGFTTESDRSISSFHCIIGRILGPVVSRRTGWDSSQARLLPLQQDLSVGGPSITPPARTITPESRTPCRWVPPRLTFSTCGVYTHPRP
jgi:hypothetical protein